MRCTASLAITIACLTIGSTAGAQPASQEAPDAGVIRGLADAGTPVDISEPARLDEQATPSADMSVDATVDPSMAPAQDPAEDIAALDLESLLDTPIASASASRRIERSSRAAASVFVLTHEDIQRYGYRSLDEVLASVPGLFVANDTLYPTAGVRGMNQLGDLTTRLLVLVDGHPLNNSVGIGQSYVGRDLPIDVGSLERVEVIKGPVGSVYGPVAYFGVINLVTRKLSAPELFAAGDLSQNRIGGGEARARAGTTVGGVEVNVFANIFRSRGADFVFSEFEASGDRDFPEGGVVTDADYLDAEGAYLTAKWQDVSARFGWSRRKKGVPTAPYSTVIGDTRNRFINRTGFAEVAWSRELFESLQLQARLAYDDFRYDDDLVYPEPPDDAGLFADIGTDKWVTGDLRATITPFENHRDTIGVEVQFHRTVQHAFYRALPSAIEDPDEGFGVGEIPLNFRTVNAYASAEQTLFDTLTLQAGLTFFDHELFGNRLTPKAAAVWQPTAEDTLKLIYAEGFRPPTMFEAFFEDGLDYVTNFALRPETTVSRELVYERRLFGIASVSASVYRNSYYQLINPATVVAPDVDPEDFDPTDPTNFRQQFVNGGRIEATGGELGIFVRKSRWLHAYGGVTYQQATFEGDLLSSAGFAPVTANFAISTRALWEPLTLAVDGTFVAARSKDLANLLPGEPVKTDPALRLNASARLDVPMLDGLTVLLGVYNLTDARLAVPVPGDHAPISEVPGAPRSVRMALGYRFE